jgi:hypothetical protein
MSNWLADQNSFNNLPKGARCNWHDEAPRSTTESRKSPPRLTADEKRVVEVDLDGAIGVTEAAEALDRLHWGLPGMPSSIRPRRGPPSNPLYRGQSGL